MKIALTLLRIKLDAHYLALVNFPQCLQLRPTFPPDTHTNTHAHNHSVLATIQSAAQKRR